MRKFEISIILLSLTMLFLLKEYMIFSILLGLILILNLLIYFARRNSQADWVKLLFGLRGPRTDTQNMTKKELYKSGLEFLVWSAFLLIALLCLLPLVYKFTHRTELHISLIVLIIILFLFMISLCAGLYLLARGLMRKQFSLRDVKECKKE